MISDLFNDNNSNNDSFMTPYSESGSSDDSFHSTDFTPLNEVLSSQFSDVLKNFNVIHINAQSIPAHFPDMLASFNTSFLSAILVSESWLKPCLPSTCYSLPGFNLIRNDRVAQGGGGVAIYLRYDIPFKIIKLSTQPPLPNEAEHLLLEITLSNTKILLGVFYSPSLHVNYFHSFEKTLKDLTPLYNHIILMGDFNTCMIKNDHRTKRLRSITDSCNLHILPLNATHTLPNCISSLLDLIIVSSPDHVSKHGQCAAVAFSHHDLIFLSYKIRTPKLRGKVLMLRNFSRIDIERLQEDARNADWSAVYSADSIDLKVETLNYILINLYDTHAPVRPVKIKHTPAPWLTDDIKSLLNKKNKARLIYNSDKSDHNRDTYRSIRNRCNTICRDAQQRHVQKSVENGDPAKIWKFLRLIGVGKSKESTISNEDVDIESLNQHFSCTSSFLNDNIKSYTLNNLSKASTPNFSPFTFNQFSDCDVKKNVLSISSSAIGCDEISRKMIVPLIDIILPILTHIFNYSISSESFPRIWKEANIIPLPKKKNPCSPSDYRPISILPFLSKVLERLVFAQFNHYLNKNSLLDSFQSGFRLGHSTVTALLKITDDIRWGMDQQQLTILTLLDFSNAFNTVDFDVLLSLLRSINISPAAIEWFQSYLRGRRQRVMVEGATSTWCELTAGVPQGGVLSPLLFSVFINSITSRISSLYHLYADDLQIYSHTSLQNLTNAINDTNTNLAAILDWSRSFGLNLNPKKTQAIIVGNSTLISRICWDNLPPIVVDGVVIPFSKSVKDLGLYIDQNLSWSLHIKESSRKMFAAASYLRRLRNSLPIPTRILLAQSLLLPILDYADACYSNLTEDQLNKLERLQNFAIRFIFGLRKYDHVSEYRIKLKWLPIRLRRNTHILSLLYCVLFDPKTPSYLKEKFEFMGANKDHSRIADKLLLRMPAHNSKFFHSSFCVKAIKLWNSLPLTIKKAQSIESFKNVVKDYYLNMCST